MTHKHTHILTIISRIFFMILGSVLVSIGRELFLIPNNINKDDLINFIDVVLVGILELINKQSEGYSYIKP